MNTNQKTLLFLLGFVVAVTLMFHIIEPFPPNHLAWIFGVIVFLFVTGLVILKIKER